MGIDDQLMLQAIANLFANRLRARRAAVENKTVFSNLLETPSDSKFFVQDWHDTFARFQNCCIGHFLGGRRWVAHFDLAAFYDTISHELLVKVVAPRDRGAHLWREVKRWLQCWSSADGSPLQHGIPQGPVASDFLAESVLLPLDEALTNDGIHYVRYVDDIRVFAKTKLEAQKAAVRLELLCRTAGLIPQGKKFALLEARSIEDAIGQFPSIAPPDSPENERTTTLSAADAESLLRRAVKGRPSAVKDKTSLRYALYRAPRSQRILGIVLRLLPRYPEHIDAFVAFLSIYTRGRAIERTAQQILLRGSPYDYVRAELWLLLSNLASRAAGARLRSAARADLGSKRQPLWLKLGAYAFLLRCEELGAGSCLARLKYQPPLLQALMVPRLPDKAFDQSQLVASLLRSASPEPGLMLATEFVSRRITHNDFGVKARELAPEVQNTFRKLRLLKSRRGVTVDQIGEILNRRFGAPATGWRSALGGEYMHCLRILVQADALFEPSRSQWLQLQNSFNDALCRSLIGLLAKHKMPGSAKLVGRDGKLVKLGSLLQVGAPFAVHHASIADPLRRANDRRNALPASHPYDEKRGVRNRHLSNREQARLVRYLRDAYMGAHAIATGMS
jgi:hypothetical protein